MKAGASIVDTPQAFAQDIVLKIRPPDIAKEVPLLGDNKR